MKEVIVTIEGGVVSDVEVPSGVRVIVRDYDVMEFDDNVQIDEAGEEYYETIWED